MIRPIKTNVESRYLKYFISSNTFQHQVEKEVTTQAQPSLSLKQVGDFIVPLPSLDEQTIIADNMESIVDLIAEKNKSLEKVKELKKALMQDLLTGKVRVKVEG